MEQKKTREITQERDANEMASYKHLPEVSKTALYSNQNVDCVFLSIYSILRQVKAKCADYSRLLATDLIIADDVERGCIGAREGVATDKNARF
jgi:hypothetical protein